MNIQKIHLRAPAKINLHLEVLGKRMDGYHELAMVMQSINLFDYLDIRLNNSDQINLSTNAKDLDVSNKNLIIKAAYLLKKKFNDRVLGADIYLEKNIPIGAGLAGGSSNAAATLVGLNELWDLRLKSYDLHGLGAMIGSDVPFCINGGTQYCFGRGEILEEFKLNSNYGLILIKNPDTSLSTAEIYKKYSSLFNLSDVSLMNEINVKRNELRNMGFEKANFLKKGINIRNDLQIIAKEESPSVKKGLGLLSELDHMLCYSMSGSGPSCYAVFENINIAKRCYQENIAKLNKENFDVWCCNFLDHGVLVD